MSADGQGCACRFIFKDGWLNLIPESECGYHRALRASADVSRDAVLEEAALIADRRSYGPDDREAGAAAGIADEIRALKRQSNSPRSDK